MASVLLIQQKSKEIANKILSALSAGNTCYAEIGEFLLEKYNMDLDQRTLRHYLKRLEELELVESAKDLGSPRSKVYFRT